MPRGGLQIVQPSPLGERWVKPYLTEFQAYDSAAWKAIIQNKPVRGDEAWPEGPEQSRFFREFLDGGKLHHVVCVPVKAPILPGYDGALCVYSKSEQGPLTDTEIKAIVDAADQLSRAAATARSTRLLHSDCANPPSWLQRVEHRVAVFNSTAKPIYGNDFSSIDDRVAEQINHDARLRLQQLGNEAVTSDRISIADARGQLWVFRAVAYRSYPALSAGSVVFYSLLPSYCDWISLRAADVSADAELNRLVPAMQFMSEHFRRGPTLGEIAKHVHLSPFHFHRRFTELLGITPKHFLLECQVFHTKRLLYARETELAEISKICGFAHQSHFTSRFKQFTGLTPTRWRKLTGRSDEPTSRSRAELTR
jgi:AraC-like DNA-binding protein